MEFEPFQSDEDDALTFMPEKKKKDKDEKRRKNKGSYKADKKEKLSFSDGSSSTAMTKTKTVHGVVGPAEYITETSPTHDELNNIYSNEPTSPTNVLTVQKPASQLFNQQTQITEDLSLSASQQWPPNQPSQIHHQQTPQPSQQQPPSAIKQQFNHHSNSTPNFQHGHFPHPSTPQQSGSNFIASTKIERPHSSAALLQERVTPQSPTPFKQPTSAQTPQKMTLLVQALAASPGQVASQSPQSQGQQPGQQQLPISQQQSNNLSSSTLTHHRSQSYSRAMSIPMSSALKQDNPEANHSFRNTFDNSREVRTKPAGSPITENPLSPFQSGESFSSPPLTPNNISSSSQELWSKAPIHPHHQHHNSHKETSPIMHKKIDLKQQHEEGDWAHFSMQTSEPTTMNDVTRSGSLSDTDHIDIPRRRSQAESMTSSMASSVPESTSSMESESENDDSLWVITSEQRDYYTNHFKKLQPTEGEVIKGPQARDFFVKSTLQNETLSRIWNLSDRDRDGALNLDEFCIAMHLVVAVVHGVELPLTLPPSLFGLQEVHHVINDDVELVDEDVSKLISDEKQDPEEWAAEFDSTDGAEIDRKERIQTYAQPSPTSITIPSEARVHPVAPDSIPHPVRDYPTDDVDVAPSSPKLQPTVITSQKDATGKMTAIARPRASANKNVNLMDASPWQLLPPPSGKVTKQQGSSVKKSLKMDSYDSGLENVGSTNTSPGNKLVAIDHSESRNVDDVSSPLENDRLKVTKKDSGCFRNLSKEKSRSIDSLRSDISESSMFEWKRQSIRRESRPRSFTGESLQNNDGAQFEGPPVPPPRNKGHTRASSLDFNQVFTTKSSRIGSEPKLPILNATTPDGAKPRPQKPPRANKSGAANATSERPLSNVEDYKRSISLDTTLRDDMNFGNKVASSSSLKSHTRVQDSSLDEGKKTNSKEHIVRFMDDPQVLSNNTKSPMEIQMRKHELQARLRDLKNKNSTLLSLISQLGMEWKEVCEERISLEIRLQRAQQELE